MAPGIPRAVLPISVVVLLYSSICFSLATMLTCLLINFGESWSYVTILSGFTALSTAFSIAQQLHYATSWVTIKQAQFDTAVLGLTQKGLVFGGAANPVDKVFFFAQYYCYNVMSLSIFFWTVTLFTGSWGIRSRWLGDWHGRMAPISKVFSVLFPVLIVGLLNTDVVRASAGLTIFVSYMGMFPTLTTGAVLLVLTLYKYIKTRRLVVGYSRRGRWWASNSEKDGGEIRSEDLSENELGSRNTETRTVTTTSKRSIYDRALLLRFTIGFLILGVFQVAMIVFTVFQLHNNRAIAASGHPNLSNSSAVSDIFLFVPGVTASLVTFLVFGTTKNWRQYRDLVLGGCGIRQKLLVKKAHKAEETTRPRGLEFERLPSLHKSPSEEERAKGKEALNRVKMFTKEIRPLDDSSIDAISSGARSDIEPRVIHFHRPLTRANVDQRSLKSGRSRQNTVTSMSAKSHSRHNISNASEPGLSTEQPEDQVIEYERPETGGQGHDKQFPQLLATDERRFVMERLPQPYQQPRSKNFIESDSGE